MLNSLKNLNEAEIMETGGGWCMVCHCYNDWSPGAIDTLGSWASLESCKSACSNHVCPNGRYGNKAYC